ncbi:MAG: hypothetical protein ACTSRB_06200 [Candidatus Helarchaeota archaeon]
MTLSSNWGVYYSKTSQNLSWRGTPTLRILSIYHDHHVHETIYLLVFFIGMAIATFRKQNFKIRFTQFAILFFMLFLIMFPIPFDWGNQFIRRMGRITSIPGINVIEPDKCATLETQFWEFTNRSDMLGIDNFSAFISHPKFPTLESQLTFVQEFLYNVSNKILDIHDSLGIIFHLLTKY